jgi:hypothetical protein
VISGNTCFVIGGHSNFECKLAKNRVERAVNSKPSRGKSATSADVPRQTVDQNICRSLESCRSIAPLQLSFLEIFKLYSRISRSAFSKGATPKRNEHLCVGLALSRHGRRGRARHASPADSSGVWIMDVPWWAESPGGLLKTQWPYTASRGQPPPVDATRRAVSMPPAAAHANRHAIASTSSYSCCWPLKTELGTSRSSSCPPSGTPQPPPLRNPASRAEPPPPFHSHTSCTA